MGATATKSTNELRTTGKSGATVTGEVTSATAKSAASRMKAGAVGLVMIMIVGIIGRL